jgi:hypothetical protein
MSPHALDRIRERAPAAIALRVHDAILAAEEKFKGDVAVRVAILPAHLGSTATDYHAREQSNGNEVWAIIRDGYCVTVLLRRSDQKRDAWAFNVSRVVLNFAY